MESFNTPILFIIFNRPEETSIVFETIRKVKPRQLFIAADGPRNDQHDEKETCSKVRKIATDINWACDVKLLFRDKNLGCGEAVSKAITWFFESVEEGIILEDDCLPDHSFYYFCQTLLSEFRNNERVMHIGGCNFQDKIVTGKYSYYFSNYIHIWGWATWRRAWKLYNFNIPTQTDNSFKNILRSRFSNSLERTYWNNSFQCMVKHCINTWDIQWVYSIYKNSGIGITPSVNLVSNIGFGPRATHTKYFNKIVAANSLQQLSRVSQMPDIKVNKSADNYTFKKLFQSGNTHFNQMKFKLGKKIPILKIIYSRILNTLNSTLVYFYK